jgi:hypothetical protein
MIAPTIEEQFDSYIVTDNPSDILFSFQVDDDS